MIGVDETGESQPHWKTVDRPPPNCLSPLDHALMQTQVLLEELVGVLLLLDVTRLILIVAATPAKSSANVVWIEVLLLFG